MTPTLLLILLCGAIAVYAVGHVFVTALDADARERRAEAAQAREAELLAEIARLSDTTPKPEAEDPTKAPWASVRAFAPYGDGPESSTRILPVSRHDIAEAGLYCPRCKTMVAKKGQYDLVRRTIINGVENEVVKCTGVMMFAGNREERCPLWLAASPDTEHGDHLKPDGTVDWKAEYDPPEFYQFKRVDAAQVIQEQHGMDVVAGAAEDELQIDPKTRLPVIYGSKYDGVLAGAELIKILHEKAGLKTLLPDGAPPAKVDPDATPTIPAKTLPAPSPFV